MYHILNFIKRQWLSVILIAIYVVLTLISNQEKKELLQKEKELSLKIQFLEAKDHEYAKKIAELSKVDTVYLDSIKIVKIKGDEKISSVANIPASKLQEYFTDRYPE
jgi:hypothetical protein